MRMKVAVKKNNCATDNGYNCEGLELRVCTIWRLQEAENGPIPLKQENFGGPATCSHSSQNQRILVCTPCSNP